MHLPLPRVKPYRKKEGNEGVKNQASSERERLEQEDFIHFIRSVYSSCSGQVIEYKELIESGLSGSVAKGSRMSGRSRSLRLNLTVKEN